MPIILTCKADSVTAAPDAKNARIDVQPDEDSSHIKRADSKRKQESKTAESRPADTAAARLDRMTTASDNNILLGRKGIMGSTTRLSSPKLYTVGWITALDKELAAARAMLDERHQKPHSFTKHPKDTNTYTWGRIGDHNIAIASLAAGRYGTAVHRMEGSRIPHILEQMTLQYPKMRESGPDGDAGFIHQGVHNDRLFEASSVHMDAATVGSPAIDQDRTCAHCDRAKEVERKDRSSEPTIHYGIIASVGHQLAEMVFTNEGIRNIVQNLATSYHLQKLEQWFSPPDPSMNYGNATKQHHIGSGQWFLRSTEYSTWKTEPNSFLWLHGIPGCGKTILTSAVITDLEKDEGVQDPLYFYFDFTDTSKQSLEKALHSLIIQLCRKNNNVQRHLDLLYDSCQQGRQQPSFDSLCKTFQNMVQQAGSVFIVLDALDECQTRKAYPTGGLLPWIQSLVDSQQTNVHLFVTSRSEQDIKSAIETWARNQDIIHIKSDLVADDISAYIHARVRQNEGLKRWQSRPEVQDEIEAVLEEKANGMFRWATCQLNVLENCLDYPTLRKELTSLPRTLDETYARILANIPLQHEHNARRLLQFLTFSERPLSIAEAVDAIAVDTESRPRFDLKNRMPAPEEISRYCSSLVVVSRDERGSGTITELQLAHFSVKEYLMSDRLPSGFAKYLEETTARACIAEVCLAYLLELDKGLPTVEVKQSYWLAEYSARYWTDHAALTESSSENVRVLTTALFSCERVRANCYRLYDPDWSCKDKSDEDNIASALYYASLGGFICSVKTLLDHGAEVNLQGGTHGDALNAASMKGHEKIVQLLLDHGADVNLDTALLAASRQGHEKTVQALLDHGTDVNVDVWRVSYCNALQAASSGGHEKIVQALLDRGADVNIQGGDYGNALQAASSGGHEKIVQVLLDRGAAVNVQGGYYGNALQAASSGGYEKVVRVLLDRGAGVNVQVGYYNNALQAASSGGHEKIVQVLLDRGADVNIQGGYYGNALQAASSGGHEKTVQILLDHGADANFRGGYYYNAISAFFSRAQEKIVQVLLDHGDVVYILSGDSNVPYAISSGGYEKIVQALLDHGTGVNVQFKDYGNALYAASSGGHEKIVQVLLDHGADVNIQGGYYGNALYAALSGGHEKTVQVLLDHGADVNVQGGRHGNALYAALSAGHEKIVQVLLNHGADINALRGRHGTTL
ncbi:Ankyrin repeat domain-containing protein 50 [Tolypocladium ophioglossoides CBS 100239]|uniref:Ankyrin repeat domain-containing protein 50 n=1 Tax=Tolypocladium ophioglossoides (strain CBS 100239) TaxID=1163406 RepID=A0A0L0N633_TOLOC|nr:Ankyrin repeat domain-containing protein 50 [Tolypocladium ophioglossoides CBS 100239]